MVKGISWKEYHKSMQEAGTVRRALKQDPEYKKWYYSKRK